MQISEIIICPECRSDNIGLSDMGRTKKVDYLQCGDCRTVYKIEDGIFRLLNKFLEDNIDASFNEMNAKNAHFAPVNADKSDTALEWKKNEKEFWDKKKYSTEPAGAKPGYNRLAPRLKHIINFLKPEIKGKTLLEFGSGDSYTIYNLLNPREFKYNLISTDLSFNALQLARKLHPDSAQIQCDACDPPFRNESLDIIVNFGTYHHLPDNIDALSKHIGLLKKGGLLAFHEPIDRRKPFINKDNKLKKKLYDYEESDHNEFIVEKEFMDLLLRKGSVIHKYYEYSPLRTFLVVFLNDRLSMKSKFIFNIINTLDQIMIRTLGRLINSFDANSLLLVWQKS